MLKPLVILSAALLTAGASFAQPVAPVSLLAASEKPKLLETLKSLVDIESGSTNRAGLDKLSTLIGERLKALGGDVQYIEPTTADVYRMEDTPENPNAIGRMVRAT